MMIDVYREKLFFYITKNTDGTYRIETPDTFLHWSPELFADKVKKEYLGSKLEYIAERSRNKYKAKALFIFRNI